MLHRGKHRSQWSHRSQLHLQADVWWKPANAWADVNQDEDKFSVMNFCWAMAATPVWRHVWMQKCWHCDINDFTETDFTQNSKCSSDDYICQCLFKTLSSGTMYSNYCLDFAITTAEKGTRWAEFSSGWNGWLNEIDEEKRGENKQEGEMKPDYSDESAKSAQPSCQRLGSVLHVV